MRILALVYLGYSILTDLIIWGGAIYLFLKTFF